MEGRTEKQSYCSTKCYKERAGAKPTKAKTKPTKAKSKAVEVDPEATIAPTDLVQYQQRDGSVVLITYAEWLRKSDTGTPTKG